METRLTNTHDLLELVAQQLCQVYFLYDTRKGTFRYLSPAFSQLWGTEAGRIQDQPALLLDCIHEEDLDFVMTQYRKVVEGQARQQAEFRICQPGDTWKWICLSACVPLPGSDPELLGGFAADITVQKEYMHNVLKYNNKKNSTLEILSHDLAAPFANIQSAIAAIEEQVGRQDAELLQLIDFIKQDSLRGSDMIRDFVDHEFLESSQVVLKKERIDLVGHIRDMMDNYKAQANLIAKNFYLLPPEKPVFLEVDVMKFLQVLNNLVSNAIKFTPDNGDITVSLADQGKAVLITVADNGIGIPDHLQPVLFDRFTKARRPGLRGEKSIGLGMSIIKTIVELHQGSITFESREQEGSIFFIRLPKE
ncbi:MAG: PAS domain-containing sensor histidine kinase [Adhaeribacter sp.]